MYLPGKGPCCRAIGCGTCQQFYIEVNSLGSVAICQRQERSSRTVPEPTLPTM